MLHKHCPQGFVGACSREAARAMIGAVLPVGLCDAHVEFAGTDDIEVVNRAAGRFDRAADAMVLAASVNQAADGATDWAIDARHTASPDRDEAARAGASDCAQGDYCDKRVKWSNPAGHLAKVVILPTEVKDDDREKATEIQA